MHLDEFPINQNGKIDRKNLPEPDIVSRRSEYKAPENDTQAMLCRAFESALGTEQVGIDDDFFALGGDSIDMDKLKGKVMRVFTDRCRGQGCGPVGRYPG